MMEYVHRHANSATDMLARLENMVLMGMDLPADGYSQPDRLGSGCYCTSGADPWIRADVSWRSRR